MSTFEYPPSAAPPTSPPAHTPPHSIEAEQAVLGTLLISERPMYALVIEEGLKPEDFFRPRHQAIYGAMYGLYERSEPIDRLTVLEYLKSRNLLEQAGGEAALDELGGPVSQSANIRQYARIVRENALLRRLLSTTSEIQLAVTSRQGDAQQLVETAERMMLEVAHDDRQKEFRNIGEILDEETTKLHELSLNDQVLTGTPSGYHDLDAITGGFQPGNLIILAARPSMGKCLVGSTLIADPLAGGSRRLDDLVATVQAGDEAWVLSIGPDLRLQPARVAGAMASGRKPVFRVTTSLGRAVVASATHPILTLQGWTPVERLRAGDRVAVPVGAPTRTLVAAGGVGETGPNRIAQPNALVVGVGWDEIVSIEPAGEEETYDLDVPGFRNFVADGIVVHNSAFVTNIAENVAINSGKAVALFSLEMGESELAQRFLASQAKIKGEELRRGRVAEHRWPKILEASNKLAQSPLFVDDSSDVSMLDIRAKSRRLHQQHGLGLIIIDYLQLLRADARIESRVQQVGEMSRGLKILARELAVPVIALSQLSRAVESRTDKKPMLSDLRECVTGDTPVLLADGRRVPIGELVDSTPEVLAVDDTGRLISAHADLVWKVGTRPVREVRLASGRTIRATDEHRIRTDDGWTHVRDLATGDRVAMARELPEPQQTTRWPETHVVLLGQMIGDGSFLKGQPMRYTTASEENSEAVRRAAEQGFGAKVTRHAGRGTWHQLLISGNGTRWQPAGVGAWLKELGIFGQRSAEKRIPQAAFQLPNDQIATLLRHLWATDGTMWVGQSGKGKTICRVAYATINPLLAQDVAALLLRLGIVARLVAAPKANASTTHHVVVTGAEQQRRFLDVVGAFGPRVPQAEALRAHLASVTTSATNVDTLPPSAFRRVRRTMVERGITQREMAALRGTSYGGAAHFAFAPSRAVVAGYAEILDDDELRAMATSQLFWDRVVDVVDAGEEPVFDLTVPGPACWLADGIVTHNSGNIEQDADLVMFLYREEYYDKETERQGLADVIIAKHRNGGLGEVELVFANEYPKFLNRAGERHGGGPPA